MNVRVLLAASSLTVKGPSALYFWATLIGLIVGLLALVSYLNKLRRAAFKRYHDDIRSVVRDENQDMRTEIRAEIATQLLPVGAELSTNHGASMKDKLDGLVGTVDSLVGTVDALTASFDKHIKEHLSGGA